MVFSILQYHVNNISMFMIWFMLQQQCNNNNFKHHREHCSDQNGTQSCKATPERLPVWSDEGSLWCLFLVADNDTSLDQLTLI